MLNGCISGQASPADQLLETWLFPGAFYLYASSFEEHKKHVSDYLYTGLFTPASMDMLNFLSVPVAGSHEAGRNATDADFDRRVTYKGYLLPYPLLISRYYDAMGGESNL